MLTALTQATLSVCKVEAECMHGVDIPFERKDELAFATRGYLRRLVSWPTGDNSQDQQCEWIG